MSKDGRWPPALLPAVTGAIVIRDFEREGRWQQLWMSRTQLDDRREH